MEISLKTPENWDAHKKRDMIDRVLLESTQKSVALYTEVLNVWKKDNQDMAGQIDQLPWERLARFSFAQKGMETFDFSVTPVYPEGLKKMCLETIKKDQASMDKSIFMKPLNWLIKKMLDEKDIKEMEGDIAESIFKKQMEIWDMAVVAGYMSIFRGLFEEFPEGNVTFYVKDDKKVKMNIGKFFELNEISKASKNKMKSV